MEFLKMKNRMFIKIFRELWDQKKYENIFYMQGNTDDLNLIDYNDYWDLVGLFFTDEEGYNRALFIPVPLLPKKYRGKIRDMAWEGKIFHCSRAWHEIPNNTYIKPDAYYPNFYFERISKKDIDNREEDHEEEQQ